MEFERARPDTGMQPVATVVGLYRGTLSGLEPLTRDTPLTRDEIRRNPIFYALDLNPDLENADLIVDLVYDNLMPMWLPDLERGTDIPRGIRFWPRWFEIPYFRTMKDMRDCDGRRVYPRAPGTHTVRIRTARRKIGQQGMMRDFSPANHGYMSPFFEITIVPGVDDV